MGNGVAGAFQGISSPKNTNNKVIDNSGSNGISIDYYIHPKSHKMDIKSQIIGFALYSYGNDEIWDINGIKCRSGLIYIEKVTNISGNIKEYLYIKLYKNLFECNIDFNRIYGIAFTCYMDNTSKLIWKYNTNIFKLPSKSGEYKVNDGLPKNERDRLQKTVYNWTLNYKITNETDIKTDTNNNEKIIKNDIKRDNIKRSMDIEWTYYDKETNKWIRFDDENQKRIETFYGKCGIWAWKMALNKGIFLDEPFKSYEYELHFNAVDLGDKYNYNDCGIKLNYKDNNNKYFVKYNKILDTTTTVKRSQIFKEA